MLIAIFVVIIAAIGLVIWGVTSQVTGSSIIKSRLPHPESTQASSRFFKLQPKLPSLFPFTRKFLEKSKLDAKIKSRIDAAHVNMTSLGFFNFKLLLMVIFCVASYIILGKIEPVAILTSIGIGYILPEFYLSQKINKRKQAISKILPETVDLLGLCIEAGLDFTTALRWIIDKTPSNPLIEEFAFILDEIRWGKPRVQALKDMSRRLNISEVISFVQTIVQAERLGTPVAEAFSMLSEDTRLQRYHRGERIAMKAPIKILLPLIFFIMPVIGIIIAGPIMLQFLTGGLAVGK